MVFARTLVVLCVAAVATASSCGSQESFHSEWWGPRRGRMAYMMDGLYCKCPDSSMREDEIWTKNACSMIGKEMVWCYAGPQAHCETGNKSTEFRELCSKRGSDCYTVECDL